MKPLDDATIAAALEVSKMVEHETSAPVWWWGRLPGACACGESYVNAVPGKAICVGCGKDCDPARLEVCSKALR